MTWNTEGHDPIPESEALPQLCYIASSMVFEGVQKISRPRLACLLKKARNELSTELGYAQDSIDTFIRRIEDRSSLLMMTGSEIEDGKLVECFEFRHLTFQEFLTAKAVVEGWHSGPNVDDSLVEVLKPFLEEDKWREIIPLTAVLGGKSSEALIQYLTKLCRPCVTSHWSKPRSGYFPHRILFSCLSDEAAASPGTARTALDAIVESGILTDAKELDLKVISQGKYGAELRSIVGSNFGKSPERVSKMGSVLASVVYWQLSGLKEFSEPNSLLGRLTKMLGSDLQIERCEAALGCSKLFSQLYNKVENVRLRPDEPLLQQLGAQLTSMLLKESIADQFSAASALIYLGLIRIWIPNSQPELLGRCLTLWLHSREPDIRKLALRAFVSQPLLPRDVKLSHELKRRAQVESIMAGYDTFNCEVTKVAALIVGWYLCTPWNDSQLFERARELNGQLRDHSSAEGIKAILRDLLTHLGHHEVRRPRKSPAGQ